MYLSKIRYEPVIITRENGNQYPMLYIQDLGLPKNLELLGSDEMQEISFVDQTIKEVEGVDKNSDKSYYIYRRCYYLKIIGNRVFFFQESYLEDFIELECNTLLELLIHWKLFLERFNGRESPAGI